MTKRLKAEDVKNVSINVPLSKAEKGWIEVKAMQEDISTAHWIRRQIFGKSRKVKENK